MAIDLTGNVCALLIVSVTSIILNSICLHVIRTKRTFREKPSTLFLVNLLIVHLVQGIVVLPMYAGKSFKDDLRDHLFWWRFFNNGFRASYFLTFYGICFGVLLISIDRFLATYLLNRYKTYVSKRNALVVLLLTWLYTLVLCIIPFIPEVETPAVKGDGGSGSNSSQLILAPTNSSVVNTTLSSTTKGSVALLNSTLLNTTMSSAIAPYSRPWKYIYKPQKEWTIFMLFANAALPFLVIVICYVYIIIKIRRVEAAQNKYQDNNMINNNNKTDMIISSGSTVAKSKSNQVKGFKKYKEITHLTILLGAIYFVLWTPSIIYYTILMVCEEGVCFPEDWNDSPPEKHIVYVIKFLSYLNAFFSPVVYCLRHPEMKKSLIEYQRKLSGKHKNMAEEVGMDNVAAETSGF